MKAAPRKRAAKRLSPRNIKRQKASKRAATAKRARPVKANPIGTATDNDGGGHSAEDSFSVELRLHRLQAASSALQRRLESIAQTLTFPLSGDRDGGERATVDPKHSEPEVVTLDPNYIEPEVVPLAPNRIEPAPDREDEPRMECQHEINRIHSVFGDLQKQIESEHRCAFDYASSLRPNPRSNVFNIFANDLVYSATPGVAAKPEVGPQHVAPPRHGLSHGDAPFVGRGPYSDSEAEETSESAMAPLSHCSSDGRPADSESQEPPQRNDDESVGREHAEQHSVSATESYSMSPKDEDSVPEIAESVGEALEAAPQSVTTKLLLELELLGSVQRTASKLESFEMDSAVKREAAIAEGRREENEISDLKAAKNELVATLDRARADIEAMERQKERNEAMAAEHLALIQRTGAEMAGLIARTQQHLHSESEQKHSELLQLSTHILSGHRQQADSEREGLQQTLNLAMELLAQYARTLRLNEEDRGAPPRGSESSAEVAGGPSPRQPEPERDSMLDRMLSDLREEQREHRPPPPRTEDLSPSSDGRTPSAGNAQIAKSETTAYSEFANEAEDGYSDDAFDALTEPKSPTSCHRVAESKTVDTASSDTATEIEFDEDTVSPPPGKRKVALSSEDIVSVATSSATEISFDAASTVIVGGAGSDSGDGLATEIESESEIQSEVAAEIESESIVAEEVEEDAAGEHEAEDPHGIDTEATSSENAEAFSTITSSLSSLVSLESASGAGDEEEVPEEDLVDGDSDCAKKAETAHSVDTEHSYGSSLQRMEVLSTDGQSNDSFSDSVSSALSESLSFLESSAKAGSGDNDDAAPAMTAGAASAADEEEDAEDADESIASDGTPGSDEQPDGGKKDADDEQRAAELALDMMSDFVSDLFKETSSLFALRQNRASIISRQNQIERTLDESVGIFAEQTAETDRGVQADSEFIASYASEILSHCEDLDWPSPAGSAKVDFSVFIEVETAADRREKQQIFNNLIFDTLNEVLAESKCNAKSTLRRPALSQLIQGVEEKMKKLDICSTTDHLKERFGDEQDIDDRIKLMSNEWIQEFEHSHEWTSTFSDFKREIKLQIADLIVDQMLTDIVSELNQMERNR